jgi:hypothetical protein
LIDILVIALCGTIAGCTSAVEIAAYGRSKRAWLKTFLQLPNGIPSHDTFSRVLQLLDPRRFHDCFLRWVQALHELTQGEVVPIDGKTLRRSFDSAGDRPALHLISAWVAANRLVLGEIPVDDQSHEITAIPKLLEILELTGAIVTIDAMGCQREIAATAREKGADYVLAVKDNQPHLYEDLSDHFDRCWRTKRSCPAPGAMPRRRRIAAGWSTGAISPHRSPRDCGIARPGATSGVSVVSSRWCTARSRRRWKYGTSSAA